jgi:hypothetical protein
MIDSIYQLVKTILNKELRGNITPAEFNLVADKAQRKIFREYFGDINLQKLKAKRGMTSKNFANLPMLTRQKIHQFSKNEALTYDVATSSFLLPKDLYFIKDRGITYNNKVIGEGKVARSAFKNSSKTSSSITFPQYEMFADSIIVSPDEIVDGVLCKYLREPLRPKWTYQVVLGTEMYDNTQGDHQDFELHVDEHDNLVIEIMSSFGVNLRDLDVSRYAEALKRITESKK